VDAGHLLDEHHPKSITLLETTIGPFPSNAHVSLSMRRSRGSSGGRFVVCAMAFTQDGRNSADIGWEAGSYREGPANGGWQA